MKQCSNCGKPFTPRKGLGKTQKVCSETCLVDAFDKLSRKTKRIARIYARTLGYRSMFEVRFKSLCQQHKLPLSYETKTVIYQYEPQEYTADFSHKKQVHLECKGVLDAATRKKLMAIKRCNPTMDLRLVLEKPNNKLHKGKSWRYWEWAEKRGFKWYDWRDLKKLKKEI